MNERTLAHKSGLYVSPQTGGPAALPGRRGGAPGWRDVPVPVIAHKCGREIAEMSSTNKTSFRKLLSQTGSNPTLSIKNVHAQRERVEQLKAGGGAAAASSGPPCKVARTSEHPAPPPSLVAPPPPPQPATAFRPAPQATTTASPSSFVPAGMFAGVRPGFVFKHGELGLGYYRDGLTGATSTAPVALASVAAAHEATDADDADGANTGALPSGFFDNPQLDPANRNKEVALTKKQQTLNEAFNEFNELVQADLQAADAGDEVAEEEEEEAKLRAEISISRELERRVAGLRERAAAASAARTGDGSAAAAAASSTSGPAKTSPPDDDHDDDDDDDDDDEEDDEDALALLNSDWRAKAI